MTSKEKIVKHLEDAIFELSKVQWQVEYDGDFENDIKLAISEVDNVKHFVADWTE